MRIRQLTICVFLLLACTLAFAQSETYWVKTSVFGGAGGTVVSQWVKHLGNPDPGEPGDTEHWGLLLSKNTASATNAAAFGQVLLRCCSGNINIKPLTELGYDLRNGGHCGAGSPRFNVVTQDNVTHFVGGCSNGTITPSTYPGWQTVRFDPSNPAQAFPPVLPTDTAVKIYVMIDEGTDAGPDFSGLDILDDIDVNGDLIGETKL